MSDTHAPAKDYEGNPIAAGDTVTAYRDGEAFTATVESIGPRLDAGSGGIVLLKDDGTREKRDPDSVTVFVPDDQPALDPDPTASIETHAEYVSFTQKGAGRTYIRLSGRNGLRPVAEGVTAQDPRTQALRDQLMSVPGVVGVAVVATVSNRARNIVLRRQVGADEVEVAQQAWRIVEQALPGVRLNRAFWQDA
jgi:hypothetical protein